MVDALLARSVGTARLMRLKVDTCDEIALAASVAALDACNSDLGTEAIDLSSFGNWFLGAEEDADPTVEYLVT